MKCDDVRRLLDDARRGTPARGRDGDELAVHLEGCAACRHEDAAEHALTDALAERMPRYTASIALKRRLAQRLTPSPWRARMRVAAPALAVGLALAASIPLYYERIVVPRAQATAQLETEAVNDHLRVLYSQHPIEIESGGIHQVKPWFLGKLDFAPRMSFAGDDDFPLQGGAIAYFLDRKAATFIFKRRLHTISLFVVRADGLAWPTDGLVPIGRVMARPAHVRGFNVLVWRDGELGYALASDLVADELATLASRIAAP